MGRYFPTKGLPVHRVLNSLQAEEITFKKVKRSVRVKQPTVVVAQPTSAAGSDSDEGSQVAGIGAPGPKAPAPKPKPQPPPVQPSVSAKQKQPATDAAAGQSAKPLSFEDDLEADDGVEFRVKKSTNSRRLARRQRLRYDKEAAAAGGGGVGAAGASTSTSFGVDNALDDEIQVVEMEDDLPVSVQELRSHVASQGIPDSRIVYQLKLQRQLAARARRAASSGESDADNNNGGGGGAGSDDSGDEDTAGGGGDAGLRVRLMGSLGPEAERRQMRDQFLSAEQGSGSDDAGATGRLIDDDDDDADGGYERQQLRRAAHLAGRSSAAAAVAEAVGFDADFGGGGGGTFSRLPASGAGYADLRARVDADRRRLAELASAETARLTAAERDMAECRVRIEDREARLPSLEAAYRDLVGLRVHLADYADCMSEKLGQVEVLERKALGALADRAQRQIRRRRQDVLDESGAGFGRDGSCDESLIRRVGEREARRMRRRRQRELNNSEAAHDSGLSTDDEETTTERMARESVLDQVRHVQENQLFADVLPEYCQLADLLGRLAQFRSAQPDLYERSRLPACLARLLAPLVRAELLAYNPLSPDCPAFDRYPWLGRVLAFLDLVGHPEEVKVLPGLVDLVLLPRITDIVEQVWDPMSSGETNRLCRVLATLAREFPTVHAGSPRTQRLFLAMHTRLAEAVTKEPYIPLMLVNQAESPFYNRQLVQAIKLFTCVLRFSELLSPAALHRLSADCLLSRYILLGLSHLPVSDRLVGRLDIILTALPPDYQLPKPFAELLKRVIAQAAGAELGTGRGLAPASRLVLKKLSGLYWVS